LGVIVTPTGMRARSDTRKAKATRRVSYLRPSPISDIRARVKREYIDTRHGYIDRLQLKLCACVALGRARLHIAPRRTTVFRRLSVHGPCAARSGSQEVKQKAGPATKVRSP